MPNPDFEDRRAAAKARLEERKAKVEAEISDLKQKRGRLRGSGPPEARLDGIEARIGRLERRLEEIDGTDPTEVMQDQATKDRTDYLP